MNITRLSWLNLINNPLNTILSLLLMIFGVGIISLLLLLNNQAEEQLQHNLRGIDMVVGAKGSPLQLILSTVYHIDNPTGNIPLNEVDKLKKNPMVELTIPLSFGDTYKGFRIVGTTYSYLELYQTSLKEGHLWKDNLQAVIGYTVAKINHLKIGDTFYGSHGLVEGGAIHDNYKYEVVGILNQSYSIIDKLILTDTETIWKVHDSDSKNHNHHHDHHHDHYHNHDSGSKNHKKSVNTKNESMITAMLVKFRNPAALIQLPRRINETTNLQAAVPAFEINRLISLFGVGIQTINIIAFIIIIVSGLSIFINLYSSLKKRRYELALMRVHGATRWQLVRLVLQEGMLISIIGTVVGMIISRFTLFIILFFLDSNNSFNSMQFNLIGEEFWLIPMAILIGIISSLIPTIQTYNIDIPKTLANE